MRLLQRIVSKIVRVLMRLAYPDHEAQQEQLRVLTRDVAHVERRLEKAADEEQKRFAALSRRIDALPTREHISRIGIDINRLRALNERQARVISKSLRRGDSRVEATKEERRALSRLERVAAGSQPILAGPWSGEVGFELLYWIPFLDWFRQEFDIDRSRFVVLSRGGVRSWYSHVAEHYLEILDHVSVDQFRQATEVAKKQRALTPFDASLLRRVRRHAGLGRVHLLHPESMYRLYWPFWKGQAPLGRVELRASYRHLTGHDLADLPPGLPRDYVAVRFYFSNCFPDTTANRAFVGDVIESIAATTDVVLLNTPFTIDDHVDYTAAGHPRVHTIGGMPPGRNLAIQTAVIRRAKAFVGTYGGYAYLAPLAGVPSVAFHSNRTFFQHHLDLAQHVFSNLEAPSLVVLDVRDTGLLRAALLRAGVERPTGAQA